MRQFWFKTSILDPRFKKLSFKHDGMLTDSMRVRAIQWLTNDFNANYEGKAAAAAAAAAGTVGNESAAPVQRHMKRRKISAAAFFADSDDTSDDKHSRGATGASADELAAYLELPQIKYTTEQDMLDWWKEHQVEFPNVALMARQYLGCPASSASVERLFSSVGVAYSAKRKRASADTLESIMFAQANLP